MPRFSVRPSFSSLSELLEYFKSTARLWGIETGAGCVGRLWKLFLKQPGLGAEILSSEDVVDRSL